MYITLRGVVVGIFLAVVVTALVWFGFGQMLLMWELDSPLKKDWQEIYLSNGLVWYGKITAIDEETIRLSGAYNLEKFVRVKDAAGADVGNMGSNAFSMGGQITPGAVDEKFILSAKSYPVYLNRSNVLFWHRLDPKSPAAKYLK